ncbi:MAG: beta-ketoacyl-ACP synthase III, partial [candidate division KSB1 bacterium]|nr:beta-ketoacyl-ACP synthase III [candidate division KSB1 bacterium]
MYKARITGTGMYVPEKVVINFDLEKLMDTSDAWIRERAGIIERRFAEPEVGPAGLAVEAAKQALQNAHLEPKDVEFIIFATLSPEYQFPGSGVLLQEKLGLPGVPALDIRNQCTGFIYGLAVADQFIRTGMYRRIMLVGSEIHSTGLDLSTRGRDVAVLFGDGAGVVIVERSDDPNRCILSSHLHADGRFAKELYVENPGSLHVPRLTKEMLDGTSIYPFMNGRQVFKHAVVRFCEAIEECLSANQIAPEQVKLVIPHQANQRITEAVAARFGYSMD